VSDPPAPARRGARGGALLAVGLVALAAALRFLALTSESLWFDEGHSILMAQAAPRDAIAALAADVHPPLYFLALGAWTRLFGESDAAMRSLSALLGAAAVGAVFVLGRRLCGSRAGVVAALLAAVSPFLVRYSQEVRPYALLTLLVAASTTALLRLADRPSSWGRRVAYGVLAALLLYTHANAAFVLVAHATWGLVRAVRNRRDDEDPPGLLRGGLVAAGVALVLFLPWLPTLLSQTARVGEGGWVPRPTWHRFYRALFAHAGGEIAFACLSVLGLAALLLPRPPGARSGARLAAALLFAIPLLAPVVVSLRGPSIFLPRTAIAAALGLFLLASIGVESLVAASARRGATWRRAGAAAAFLLVAGALAVQARTLSIQVGKPYNSQVREAVARVDADARPGDAVSTGHEFERAVVRHYLARTDLLVLEAGALPPPEVSRVWALVTIHGKDPLRQTEILEKAGFRPATVDRLHRLELRRLDRP
jgi:uncharacterized membrane protein